MSYVIDVNLKAFINGVSRCGYSVFIQTKSYSIKMKERENVI